MTSRNLKQNRGLTLVELLLVIVLIAILAAIAIPSLLAYRRSANEGSAVSTLRTLHSAEMTYQSSDREGNFAGSLAILNESSLIDSALGSGSKSGYAFTGGKIDASNENLAMFFYSAIPAKADGINRTGSRRFGIATDGVIRYSDADIGTQFNDVPDVLSFGPYNN